MENKIEIYKTAKGTKFSVQLVQDTVWLNLQQLTILFERDIKTIGKHINNVYNDKELEPNWTVAKFATVQKEGKRDVEREIGFYNLDVIICFDYRVNSK